MADSYLDWCLERNPSLTGGLSEGDVHLVLPSGETFFSLDIPECHGELITYMILWVESSSRKTATVHGDLVEVTGENTIPLSQCRLIKK